MIVINQYHNGLIGGIRITIINTITSRFAISIGNDLQLVRKYKWNITQNSWTMLHN